MKNTLKSLLEETILKKGITKWIYYEIATISKEQAMVTLQIKSALEGEIKSMG